MKQLNRSALIVRYYSLRKEWKTAVNHVLASFTKEWDEYIAVLEYRLTNMLIILNSKSYEKSNNV